MIPSRFMDTNEPLNPSWPFTAPSWPLHGGRPSPRPGGISGWVRAVRRQQAPPTTAAAKHSSRMPRIVRGPGHRGLWLPSPMASAVARCWFRFYHHQRWACWHQRRLLSASDPKATPPRGVGGRGGGNTRGETMVIEIAAAPRIVVLVSLLLPITRLLPPIS